MSAILTKYWLYFYVCMYAYVYILSLSHNQVSKSLKILLVNANIIQLVTLTLQFPDYRYEKSK